MAVSDNGYMKKQLELLLAKIKNVDNEVLAKSLNNVHAKEMFSLVVEGNENGRLTRFFVAGKKLKPFRAQLHTHRYPLAITVIKGNVVQHVAEIVKKGIAIERFIYKSPLNGGNGLEFDKMVHIKLTETHIPVGSIVFMSHEEYHTISCSKGAIWSVEEMGFMGDQSFVLGVPFTVGQLYTEPKQYQINDKMVQVRKEIEKLLKDY